jgi:hypothetical protein
LQDLRVFYVFQIYFTKGKHQINLGHWFNLRQLGFNEKQRGILILILIVQSRFDSGRTEHRGTMAGGMGGPSLSYGVWQLTWSLPTWPRRQEEVVLLTYGGGRLAAVVRVSRSLTVVGAASSGALAPRIAMVAVEVWLPPPGNQLAQEAPTWWCDGGGLLDNGGYLLGQIRMGESSIYRGNPIYS